MSNRDSLAAEHNEVLDLSRRIRVLMVVANPTTHPVLGWPLGFWAAELTHPWVEFTDSGYDITIASPDGGKVLVDGLSDPRDPSKWSADDITSLGFLNSPDCVALLENTSRLDEVDLSLYDALVVCGGQSPMYTYRDNKDLQSAAIRHFYEAKKVTAIFCHGVSALVDVKLSDGKYLVEGRTVTGFANVEEDYSDAFVGQQVMPWRLEDALRERAANYVQGGRFKAFCVRDGNLITGQQQYSGRKVARMVIAALGCLRFSGIRIGCTATLLATVPGSGIMGERIAAGSIATALFANAIATGAVLVALTLAHLRFSSKPCSDESPKRSEVAAPPGDVPVSVAAQSIGAV